MNRKAVEEKARRVASGTFSDGTMHTMLYERIVDAFCPTPELPPRVDLQARCSGTKLIQSLTGGALVPCSGCQDCA